eukprot:608094-Hanusia_phi.AAC.1
MMPVPVTVGNGAVPQCPSSPAAAEPRSLGHLPYGPQSPKSQCSSGDHMSDRSDIMMLDHRHI